MFHIVSAEAGTPSHPAPVNFKTITPKSTSKPGYDRNRAFLAQGESNIDSSRLDNDFINQLLEREKSRIEMIERVTQLEKSLQFHESVHRDKDTQLRHYQEIINDLQSDVQNFVSFKTECFI